MKSHHHHIIFALFAGFYFVLKYQSFNIPLFWDELGVYGRGAFYMFDHKLSLLPSSMIPEISRGHPLLFTFLISGFMKIFGDSIFVMRLGHFILVLMLFYSVFRITLERVGFKGALFATILVSIQPIIFAQAGIVLPELTLSLFVLLALHFVSKGYFWRYVLFMSMAMLIKETAIVFIGAIGLFYGFSHLLKKQFISCLQTLKYLTPIVPFLVFLLIQKATFGWYFFPYHAEGISFKTEPLLNNLNDFSIFLFISQGRNLLSLIVSLAIFVLLFKKRIKLDPFYKLCAVSFLCYLIFSSSSFYMNRYLIPILCVMIPFCGYILTTFINLLTNRFHNLSYALFLFIFSLASAKYLKPDIQKEYFRYGEDMNYVEQILSCKQIIDYTYGLDREANSFKVEFPLAFALMDSRYGYIKEDNDFEVVKKLEDYPDYFLFTSPPGAFPQGWDQTKNKSIKKWETNFLKAEVFKLDNKKGDHHK